MKSVAAAMAKTAIKVIIYHFKMKILKNIHPSLKTLFTNRLHKNKSGQSLIFVALVLFTLVCFFAFTINSGHRIMTKIQTQNAVDAATYTSGIWYARSLNMLSVLNVGMTECLALIILSEAFVDIVDMTETTIKYTEKVTRILCESGIPYVSPIACAYLYGCVLPNKVVELPFLKTVSKALDKGIPFLWQAMRGLRIMEDAIVPATKAIAPWEAYEIAVKNGASGAVVLPMLQDPPVHEGVFEDLCPPTRDNDPSSNGTYPYPGYPNFLCWKNALELEVNLPLIGGKIKDGLHALLLPTICLPTSPYLQWNRYVRDAGNALCGGSRGFTRPESTWDCNTCFYNDGSATWQGYDRLEISFLSSGCDSPQIGSVSGREITTIGTYPGSLNSSDIIDDDPCRLCREWKETDWESCSCSEYNCTRGCPNNPDIDDTGSKQVDHFYREEWALQKCQYDVEDSVDVDIPSDSDKPAPYVLDDDWYKHSNFTGIVWRDITKGFTWRGSEGQPVRSLKSDQAGTEVIFGKGGEGTEGTEILLQDITYSTAQVQIYNPTHADLFNQDWRVRLTQLNMQDLIANIGVGGINLGEVLPPEVLGILSTGLKEINIH